MQPRADSPFEQHFILCFTKSLYTILQYFQIKLFVNNYFTKSLYTIFIILSTQTLQIFCKQLVKPVSLARHTSVGLAADPKRQAHRRAAFGACSLRCPRSPVSRCRSRCAMRSRRARQPFGAHLIPTSWGNTPCRSRISTAMPTAPNASR